MKALRFIVLLLASSIYLLASTAPVHAAAVKPFAPFSEEGNPDGEYFFDIFGLYRFIRPRSLEIYENANRSRNYEHVEVCPGPDADRRDPYCNNQNDDCDGGDVDICYAEAGPGGP